MFDFPNSPTTGQTVTGGNGASYKWDGTKWTAGLGSGGVTTWNTRSGAVTMTSADITAAGGAPLASPAFTGTPTAPTVAATDSSTVVATTAFVHAVATAPVLRSYLAGLTLSTAGSSATFSVAPGVAADSTNAQMMTLNASINKTTAVWAVGTGNGALDTGTIASSTWYHVFLIERTDLTVVDVLVSLSATAPTMPANYTFFRRIAAMRTNAGGQWVSFTQRGDSFIWSGGTFVDANGVAATTASRTLATLTVPAGVNVNALTRVAVSGAATAGLLVSSPDELDGAVSSTGTGVTCRTTAASDTGGAECNTTTNTSAQVGVRASAACNYYISTYGWIDRRGRDA